MGKKIDLDAQRGNGIISRSKNLRHQRNQFNLNESPSFSIDEQDQDYQNEQEETNNQENFNEQESETPNYLNDNQDDEQYDEESEEYDSQEEMIQNKENQIKNSGKAIKKTATTLAIKYLVPKKFKIIFVAVLLVVVFPLLLTMMALATSGNISSGIGLSGYDYYAGACDKVKVKGNLISMDEYVAGVISMEVPGFTDETLKTFAIGARTFVIANARKVGDDNDCYYNVTNVSDSFQVYTDKTAAEQYKNAANATRGLIITVDGKPKGNYDASCMYTAAQARAKTPDQEFDDNYYYIKYGGWTIGGDNYQKVEKDKALSVGTFKGYIGDANNGNPCSGNHGGGMSQNGAGYLEKYDGYNFEKIIDYYFQGKAKIMSIYKGATSGGSYSGDYPIEPNNELYSNNKFLINTTISNVLSNNGSSLEKFNENLKSEIEKAGVGTREASVAAAVTLIGSLAEQGYKIYYQWGGIHPRLGLDSNYGTLIDNTKICSTYKSKTNPQKCINYYKWYGFDCGGFVEWAIYNGTQGSKAPTGAKVSRAAIFSYSENSKISLKSDKAVCKIGGVLDSANHITLIVGHDDANKRYIVAEAAGAELAEGTGGVQLSHYPYGAKGYWCSNLDEIYGD